jgi:hypothetical protein
MLWIIGFDVDAAIVVGFVVSRVDGVVGRGRMRWSRMSRCVSGSDRVVLVLLR